MKKLLLVFAISLFIFSCKDDEPPTPDPLVFGEAGTHSVSTFTLPSYAYTTIYYPSDIATMAEHTPLLFFISGWHSGGALSTTYDSLLRFIASKGYTVIYTNEGATTDETFAINAFDTFLSNANTTLQNNILAYTDTSKIGVLGSSAGGGLIFPTLKHFTGLGYGANGRFLMAFDPWFAFGMSATDMQNLPTNTNVVIIKFGTGGNNAADGTDARIPLTEYSLLSSIANNKKDYQIYDQENADHAYPKGTRPYSQMQGILRPLDALMLYTFSNQTEEVRTVALENGNDNPYGSGIQVVLPTYDYPCNGASTLIDYCTIVP
jgi:hypothetical protein